MTTSTNDVAKPRRPRKAAAATAGGVETLAAAGEVIADKTNTEKLLPGALNLDALEREGRPEPFAFIHNNRQYILADPQDQDWQQLLVVVSNPLLFLRLVLEEKDRDSFFEDSMPAWKLNALTKAYRQHYGLPELGEANGLSV